jgi:predicted transcriptional regulator
MVSKNTGLKGGETQAKTLTLLVLWDLGGAKTEVKKSDLTKRVTRTNEKAKDYQPVFEQLQATGAIAITTTNRVAKISLTDTGVQILGDGLKNSNFEFDGNQIGARVANALVKWIRQIDSVGISQASSDKELKQDHQVAISSYDEFKSTVLEVYDKLNYEYNFNHLVPIYRIRRAIGDRVSRSEFNDWLLEMQADDILQLQGGTVEDNAPDKIQDSITTVLDGLRCYAKLLKA